MAQAHSRRHLTAEVQIRSQTSPYEICGAQNLTRTDFHPSISILLRPYHCTNALHAFIHHRQCAMLATDSVVNLHTESQM